MGLTPVPAGHDLPVGVSVGNIRYPSVTALIDGGFVLVWSSLGAGILGKRFAADGTPIGTQFTVSSSASSGDPSLAPFADGGFVVAYRDSAEIVAQRYGGDGSVVANQFQVNTYTNNTQSSPSVASLSDGGFVVAWSSPDQDGSDGGIYGQRYGSDGLALNSEFRINTYTSGNQGSAHVAALAQGGFVVTWTSVGQDGDGTGIYGQRFSTNGSSLGGEFQVNTNTASFQSTPFVAGLSDGGFVVTWSSLNQDGAGRGIYSQQYNADGLAIGSEFRVNTHTADDQDDSTVTPLQDGGFLVTWTSLKQDGNKWGVYGQRYLASGVPAGTEFRINEVAAASEFVDVLLDQKTTSTTLSDGRVVQLWGGFDYSLLDIYFRLVEVPSASSSYTVAPSSPTATEGAIATFTIARSGDLPVETLYASTLHGAANGYSVNAGDYATNLNNLPVPFALGQTSATVTLAVTDDIAPESEESFGFIVQRSPNDPITTFLAQTNWAIPDNDSPSTAYSITPNPGTVNESAGSLVFTLSRSGVLDAETVYVSTLQGVANGYSSNSGDYATDIKNLPISFASGQASQPVIVTILDDVASESWETFGLIAQRNATDVPAIYLTKSSFSIQDDDGGASAGWSVAPLSSSLDEGDGGRTFTVTRPDANQAVTIYVSTAQTEGFINVGDYGGLANYALTFTVGETSKPVTVSIVDDAVVEENETFGLVVQQSDRDPLATYLAKSTFTIDDNDKIQASLSVALSSDISVEENDGFAVLTASLDRPASQTVSVFYSTIPGTASSAAGDYDGVIDQKIVFNPGEQTQQVKVHLLNDERSEAVEHFDVVLQDPQGISLGRDLARISITDDETNLAPAARQSSAEFMAILAKAAYYTPPETNPTPLDNPTGDNDLATILYKDTLPRYGFNFLTSVDLPALAPRSVPNSDYPVLGLAQDGLFVNENAAAIVGTIGSALYIAFRGTNDANLFGPDRLQWANKEAHYALFNDEAQGANFTKAITDYLNTHSEIRQVYVTGHSLGSAIAQAFMRDKDGPAYVTLPSFQAITFASPGYGPGVDVSDPRIVNIYQEADIIRSAEFVSRTAGSDFIIHDSSWSTSFSPVALHDMSLYLAVAQKLSEANIDVTKRSWFDYLTLQKAHLNLDISRDDRDLDGDHNPWIVKMPGITSSLVTEVKNVIVAPSAFDEVIAGVAAEGYYPLYYTGHLIQSVVVDLAKGVAEGIAVGVDKLTDVLSVVTGPGNDKILGNAFGNVIEAGAGADWVLGGLGFDWLIGGSGEGDDVYDGGGDVDTVVYSSTTQGVYVNLAAAINQAIGPEIGTDQIIDVENLIGGSGIDTLIGNSLANRLDGGAAADYLLGGVGNDFYRVDDTFDLVDEGGAFPTLGGSGLDFDTISSTAEWFWDVYSVGERLQVEEGAVGSDGAGTTIVGSVFSNEMIGNSGTNIMFGRGGADSYRAGDGVDWISLSLLGVTEENSYVGVDAANTIIVDKRTTGGSSYDIIFEFEVGRDKIDVRSYGYISAAQVLARGTNDGHGNSYYALGDGFDYVFLVGVTMENVSAIDFIVRPRPVFGEI